MLERDYKPYNEVLYIQIQYNTLSVLYRWIHWTDFAEILAVPKYNINVVMYVLDMSSTVYILVVH